MMDKAKILLTAKAELTRHRWEIFNENQPSIEPGSGFMVTGCPRCRKKLNTTGEYLRHLSDDVMPSIVTLVLTLGKPD